jgi:glutamate racemase
VRDFAVEIADLLAGLDIKMLVVACNTATAAACGHLAHRYSFPVVGVIEPGAREAVRVTRFGRIGVVATNGTVKSGAYGHTVRALLPSAVVVERSASWLVPVIERGALARPQLQAQLWETLVEMRSHDIDTLILGCTHFPIVRDLFDAGAGDNVTILDSAATTADEVAHLLIDLDLLADSETMHRILVTGPAEAFAERAQAMFRSSPEIEEINLVPDPVPGR